MGHCAFSQTITAQQSVKETKKEAEKLSKKITKRHFKKFKTNYEKALWVMSVIEKNATTSKFGYDMLADKIPGWIAMNDVLEQFPGGEISYKGETIELQVKDYRPLLKEARAKAAKAHMNAALKIINSTTRFTTREEALHHFGKVSRYSNEYQNEIRQESAKIYYDEGLRIYNASTDFSNQLKCGVYFQKANGFIPNYKDNNNLLAELYYNEGVKQASTETLDALVKASKYLTQANHYAPNYKNTSELLKKVHEKGAEISYHAAEAKENEGSFEAEKEAAQFYSEANRWIPGFLDAAEKAKMAEIRARVDVIVVNKNGRCIPPSTLSKDIKSKTRDHIHFPDCQNILKNVDLRYRDNYNLAARKLGHGFILIRMENDPNYKPYYTHPNPKVSTRIYTAYTQRLLKDGKYYDKKISESQYNILKRMDSKGLAKHTGYVKTAVYHTYLFTRKIMETWDIRDPQYPVMIDAVPLLYVFNSTMKRVYFTGDAKAKPPTVKTGTFGQLKSKADLLNEYYRSDFTPRLNENATKVLKVLNNEISYREL